MITPDKVIEAVITELNNNKVALGITKAAEISEDKEESSIKPPYCAVYEEPDAGQELEDGTVSSVLININVLIFSNKQKTAGAAAAEAWNITAKAARVLQGVYSLENDLGESEDVQLTLKEKPFDVYAKSAEQTIIIVHLNYHTGVID
jgi:hypothetical protein